MGRISEEDVGRVRDATDVVALINETVPLRQKGRLYWGLCPFHGEKTPSFKVDPGTQLWHCFGCGLGGDAFGFLMKSQNMEFPDVVRLLAERARIEIVEEGGPGVPQGRKERLIAACEDAAVFFGRQLAASKDAGADKARSYLAGRGFGSEVAKRWRLGYAPAGRASLATHLAQSGFTRDEIVEANLALVGDDGRVKDRFFDRVMFPIADLQGRTIAFGGRVIGQGEPKYLNSAETPVFHKKTNLFAIDRAKSEIVATGTAIVVEGYTDVIALHEAGMRNVVATLGTALTAQHVKVLGRFAKRIVYLFDGDAAGMRAADRAGEFLDHTATPEAGTTRVDLLVAVIPAGQDPADYVAAAGADAMRELVEGAAPLLRFVIDRRLESFDTTAPEGRAKALQAAVSVIAQVRGSLLAQDYANYVADRLRTDYATVAAALKTARPASTHAHDADAEPAGERAVREAAPDARTLAERELLRVVVAAPEARTRVRDLLTESGALADESTARLIRAVCEAGDATGKALYGAVAGRDAGAAEALSNYLVEPLDRESALARLDEVHDRVHEFALAAQAAELHATMRSIDPVKESGRYDELFQKAGEVRRRLEELRARLSSGRSG